MLEYSYEFNKVVILHLGHKREKYYLTRECDNASFCCIKSRKKMLDNKIKAVI